MSKKTINPYGKRERNMARAKQNRPYRPNKEAREREAENRRLDEENRKEEARDRAQGFEDGVFVGDARQWRNLQARRRYWEKKDEARIDLLMARDEARA